MDADVQLISCWEECFFRRKGEIGFFLFFSFSFPRHIFYLYVCIKDCQEMHLDPKSRISHSSSQITAFQVPFFVISAQINYRQSPVDRWPISCRKKESLFHQYQKEWHLWHFSCSSPPPRFTFFMKFIFWLIFSAARANASLIKFPHHPSFIQLVGSLAPQQPSASAFSVNTQLLLASPKKNLLHIKL